MLLDIACLPDNIALMLSRMSKVIGAWMLLSLLLCACSTEQTVSGNETDTPVRSSWKYKSVAANTESWDALREEFRLPEYGDVPAVQAQINWYKNHPQYFQRICTRASPYLYYIRKELRERNMPGELALLPIIESAYDPFVYSNKGAAGLWQIMPVTGTNFGLKQNWWYDGRRDVYASTRAALNYLSYLHKFFQGDWLLAIAAYDTGEGTVLNAIRRNAQNTENTDFWSLHLSRETTTYVPRLLAVASILRNHESFNLPLPSLKNEPYFKTVSLDSQIGLNQAAKLANMTLDELFVLNPGFNRWATAPGGPHRLLLPIGKATLFEKKLANLPQEQRVSWQHHVVKRGDTLSKIAKRYGSSSMMIQKLNKLRHSRMLSIGKDLIIPITKRIIPQGREFQSLYKIPKLFASKTKHLFSRHKVIHTVQHGETLAKIARKHHVSATKLRSWNKLGQHANLHPGQHLILWRHKKLYNAPAPETIAHDYQVKKGDNLVDIAKRFDLSARVIRQQNHLSNNRIVVGQHLKVVTRADAPRYELYHVKSGDTLGRVARKHHLNQKQLKQLNRLHRNQLIVGQTLKIPVKV